MPGTLDRNAKIYIAGHRGLVGSAIWRHFHDQGFTNLIGATSTELDLRDAHATHTFIHREKPHVIIDAAAKVGGILANSTYPAEFLSDNQRIQLNLMDAAATAGVEKFLFLGSSCIYPKHAEQPIREDSLLTGPLEETNIAYAIAKISGIIAIQSHRTQYGRHWISAMPTNLYGPGDNFDPQNSHVLPAMIRRFHEAKENGTDTVTIWGTGTPRREFLHVDDLAAACLTLLENYDNPAPINIGTGEDITIADLAYLVADIVGFTGTITLDPTKPDGTPRKLLDVTNIKNLGWQPRISLREGITDAYNWYKNNTTDARGANVADHTTHS
ncbi:GDP-L-fucose synthase [Dermatophilus congolensis]|uniref:GDP-L-fucose synthase n=1 Tax=Dermatophilus congolensis TaxID=1863 RepID=A0A239VWD5_9MICO|nr:GDP-L-fucose synthase [Dermatophilus congolensis]SNV25864.1 GDP-L-fucose synthase [Dermatophilus congolensis]